MFSFQIFILCLTVWIIQSDDSSEGSIKDIVRDELQDLRLEFARTNSRLQRLTLAMESFPSDTAAMKDQLKELKRRAGFLEKKLYSTLQDLLSERQNRIEMTSSFERKIAILEEKVDELWTETSIKIADGDSQRKFAKYWSEKFKSLKENTEVMMFRSMNDTRSEVSQLKQALSRTNSKNDKQECFSGAAKDYIGRRKTTVSGLQCQRWDSQNPHEHHYKESQFSDCSFCEARNYCRDPGDDGFLWCYTTDPNKRWEGCGIPWCEEPERNNDTHDCYLITEEDRFSGASDKQICESNSNRFEVVSDQIWPKCEECCCQIKDCFKTNCTGCYTGTWHRTQTGRECQRWDSQTPHKHKATDGEKFQQDQSVTGAQNYCRDPTESGFLWCYTMDPNERWEKCGILEC